MTITIKSNPDGVSGAIQVNGVDAVTVDKTGIIQGAPFSFRNKIINGDMNIAQRWTSFAGVTSAQYVTDRFFAFNGSSGAITVSQQADAPSDNEFQNSLRVAVTTADASIAAGDTCGVAQYIEGYNVRDLIGKTFTLSFKVRSSKTGIHCVAFRNSAPDRSYIAEYTVNAANTWETKTITVSGGLITAGTWIWTNGTGLQVLWALTPASTYTTTAGAWNTGVFSQTSNQVNCLDTVGNIFAITGVQLEAGSIATPFEHRPYGTEERLCFRYARPIPASWDIAYTAMYAYGMFRHSFDPMRATPTVTSAGTFTAGGGSNGTVSVEVRTNGSLIVNNSANNWGPGNGITYSGGFLSAEL